MTLYIESTPRDMTEFVCSCGHWFLSPDDYKVLGCSACGRDLAVSNGKVEVLTVKPKKEYLIDA